MGQKYFTVPTEVGQRKILQHAHAGTKLNVTRFAVGDAGGIEYIPTPDMTELKNKVWEGSVTHIEIADIGKGKVTYKASIDANDGVFSIREIAVFDDEGDMVAVANTPLTEQTDPSTGALTGVTVSLTLVTDYLEAISLVVDTSVVGATKQDIADHNQDEQAHPYILSQLLTKADVLKDLKYIFVSPTGNDVTGDGTESNPLATLQAAIKLLEQISWIGQKTITMSSGTYNTGDLVLSGVSSGLIIRSKTGAANDVVLVGSKWAVNVMACASIHFGALTFKNTIYATNTACVLLQQGTFAELRDCVITTQGTKNAVGVTIDRAKGVVYNCTIDNFEIGMDYSNTSDGGVNSTRNTRSNIFLKSAQNSLARVTNSTTTAPTEFTKDGSGIIFKNGVQV